MKAKTMEDVKRNNKASGGFWFSPDTIRFFQSKVESELINGKYFVTSEKNMEDDPRLYTIRKYNPETHKIDTLGSFQAFKTLQDALDAIPMEG